MDWLGELERIEQLESDILSGLSDELRKLDELLTKLDSGEV